MPFREEVINTKLAELLCEYGIKASPEIIKHRKLPDVYISVQGVNIIIEGKTGNWLQLKEEAKERIRLSLSDISLAIPYGSNLRESENLKELESKLRQYKYSGSIFFQEYSGITEMLFKDLNINELADIIQKTLSLIVNADILKEIIKNTQSEIESIVNGLSESNLWFDDDALLKRIAQILAIKGAVAKRQRKDVTRIAIFMLLDAMIFHEEIAGINSSIKKINQVSDLFQLFFTEEWKKILTIDYVPIFRLAYDILTSLPSSYETEVDLAAIKNMALKILSSGILRKHDFMGRIYHKLLLKTTGGYYATYYTAVPSAYLLSNLVFKTPHDDWKFDSLDSLKEFKINDIACGSGTLLSASYVALRDIYNGILDLEDFKDFHKLMLEKIIWGWDILDYAAHLTLTVLGLHNPSTLIKGSNIYTLPNGIDERGVHLGSISYFESQGRLQGKGFTTPSFQQGIDGARERYVFMDIPPEGFDVIIMNPPFSRSAKPNLKFGYSDPEVKEKMEKKLKEIIKEKKLTGIGQAGLGAIFIILGDMLLKQNGRMGVVIPRAILSGVSWEKIRKVLSKKYEIIYIISNFDPGDTGLEIEPWNWSEDTGLGEIMFVVEKTNKLLKNREVTYINLWNKPSNEIKSILYSFQIKPKELSGYLSDGIYKIIKDGDKEVGAYYKVKQHDLEENWLSPCVFANPNLNKFIVDLKTIVKLEYFSKYVLNNGIDIKQVKTAFSESATITPYRIVWGQQSSMKSIFLDNNFIGYGRIKSRNAIRLHNDNSSTFMISERPHLNNDTLIAFETQVNSLATAFWEIKLKNNFNDCMPLFILWFNSTFGLLLYLSISTNSMGEIFKTKKGQLEFLKSPNLKEYSDDIILKAKQLYDQIKTDDFQSFPEEFLLASQEKGLRKQIDDFFIKELNLDIDLGPYYAMLANEPILTLKRL